MPVWLELFVLLLLVAYTIFTGSSPSVVRAAIMGSVLLVGPLLGRRYDPLAALAVTAAVMVLFDPDLLADAGFQFSFTAVLGIAMISPLVLSLFGKVHLAKVHLPGIVAVPLAVGVGAQLGSLPFVTLMTGWVSLVGPFATLTADLALLPLMLTGIVMVIAGAVSATAASLLGLLVWPFAWWLIANAEFWSSLPWAGVYVNGISIVHIAAYYAALAFIIAFVSKSRRARVAGFARPAVSTAALGMIALAVWTAAIFVLVS